VVAGKEGNYKKVVFFFAGFLFAASQRFYLVKDHFKVKQLLQYILR